MAAYPPKAWEVRHIEDMANMEASLQTEDTYSVQALLAIPPAEGEEGSYRFLVAGRDHLSIEVPVTNIIRDSRFSDLTITAQFQPGVQVAIDANSSCSPWTDVVDMVRAQDVDVLDSEGKLAGDTFCRLIEEYQNSKPAVPAGICWRWILGLKDNPKDIYLMLQALPCSIDAIEVTTLPITLVLPKVSTFALPKSN